MADMQREIQQHRQELQAMTQRAAVVTTTLLLHYYYYCYYYYNYYYCVNQPVELGRRELLN